MTAVGELLRSDPIAKQTAERSVRVARSTGSPSALAYCLFTLALTLSNEDQERAVRLLDESRKAAEDAANNYALIVADGVRSSLLSQAGEYEAAARAFFEGAQRALRDGRREQHAFHLSCVVGCFAARGLTEPAATLWGYVDAAVGTAHDPMANLNIPRQAKDALAHLPEQLGHDRFAQLKAEGSMMNDQEASKFAEDSIIQMTAGHAVPG
jgi:hypothetical protein